MSEESEMTGEAVARWSQRFAASDALSQLFDEGDVEVSQDALDPFDVSRDDGHVTVTFHHAIDDQHSVRAVGVFDAVEETLVRAELEESFVAAPLAGNGTVWRYEDGEVTKSRWIS